MQVQSGLLFETPRDIYARVFCELRPRTPLPDIRVEFRRFANANSFIRYHDGVLDVRIADVLEAAPAPVHEALAFILVGKLFRKPVAAAYNLRYRRWLNRADVRRDLLHVRSLRGRKYLSGAKGERYDLDEIFENLNLRFFHGLMARPVLSWSRGRSVTMLGHWDPAHNAIVISKALDGADVPRVAIEYVMFHEMLHLRFPVEHHGPRRCVHTAEFRAAEKEFPGFKEAKLALRSLGK
jgi:hypothetical protein